MFEFYTPTFQNLNFILKILGVFEFYFLNFGSVWILYPKVSKFVGVKSKQYQTLRGKIQTPQTSGGKIQILKL